MHDSSETMEDSFTLSASSYEIERRSLPVTISVTIIPVNDEPPMVTRNTGLEVRLLSLTVRWQHFRVNEVERCWMGNWWQHREHKVCFLSTYYMFYHECRGFPNVLYYDTHLISACACWTVRLLINLSVLIRCPNHKKRKKEQKNEWPHKNLWGSELQKGSRFVTTCWCFKL